VAAPQNLSVLFIGGTGTISASCVRRSVAAGMSVSVLNRGRNVKHRSLPDSVTWLQADVADAASVRKAIGDLEFDVVANFLSYNAADAAQAVGIFGGRTRQYLHISTASLYRKPILQWPIVESNLRQNPFVSYSREKIAAEDELMRACVTTGFPVTIVRPSHTYDQANPPLPGDWTAVDRIARGAEIIVPGDGTSLWTLTHADDFAQGLVGLLGNPRAIGEVFHITSDDVYTWDQIYTIVAGALGVEPRIVHIAADDILAGAPDWFWSELIVGDLSHSAIFDNAKIRRYVPDFAPRLTFHAGALDLIRWRAEHPEESQPAPAVDAIMDRLVGGFHSARDVYTALGRDRLRAAGPGGCVLDRMTSVVASSTRFWKPIIESAPSRVRVARVAISASGWRSVVSGGETHCAIGMSSKPTTLRSSGSRRPFCRAASYTPIA
jgi:nucleoside-diphosphate-sugar epimerase